MAYEIPGFSFTLVAAEDFRTSQFCAADVNGAGLAITPTADGARAIGVVQNKPNIGGGWANWYAGYDADRAL